MSSNLLPPESTQIEKDVVEAACRHDAIAVELEKARTAKFVNRPSSYLPWLVIEYGLGEISKYFADQNDTIDTGIPWQRKKGTPWAIFESLSWVGYGSLVLHDDYSSRVLWNRYQMQMGLVPAANVEDPLLYDAEFLAGISDARRSVFWRGFEGYDVRALEWGKGVWGGTIWGDDSGVRMPDGSVKWSHGEDYVLSVKLSDQTIEELSMDVENGDVIGWDDIPWNTPGVSWSGIADAKAYKKFLLSRLTVYLGFFDESDNPIGYRRFVGSRDVSGDYPASDPEVRVEYSFRTDFGDGDGKTVKNVSLFVFYEPADQASYGKLWVAPEEVSFEPDLSGAEIDIEMTPLSLTFRKTVREHVLITVEI